MFSKIIFNLVKLEMPKILLKNLFILQLKITQ